MGNYFSRNQAASLEKQKVTALASEADYHRWKRHTSHALHSCGYGKILTDRAYATNNKHDNRSVWSQLAMATLDGEGYHLVEQHEENQDGHAAWKSLEGWYESEHLTSDSADDLRSKLNQNRLSSGITANTYISTFRILIKDLGRIPGEALSESQTRQIFLDNIDDSRYKNDVDAIRRDHKPLSDAFIIIRATEKRNKATASRKRQWAPHRSRRQQPGNNFSYYHDQDPSSEDEVTPHGPAKRTRRTGPMTITPDAKSGRISVNSTTWQHGLDEPMKAYIQKWNSAVKNNEDPSTIRVPDGLSIVSPSKTPSKARRGQTGTGARRKIQFHINNPNDDDTTSEDTRQE